MGESEIQVVANEKVEPPVAVVIEKRSTDAPTRDVGAGFGSDISKCTVSVVAPHLVVAEIRDIEIDPAVIIEVRGRDTHAISLGPDPAFFRNVNEFERASAIGIAYRIVAVKSATQRQLGMKYGLAHVHRSQHCALDKKDVEIAVVVVVEQCDAGPHHFRIKMETRHAVEMHKVDPGLFGPVAENLFCRCWRWSKRKPAAESRGRSQLCEVTSIDAIPQG